MINYTLTSLILSSIYSTSPFLTMPLKNQISSNMISDFRFSHYFSNFYFSPNSDHHKTQAIIKNSYFSKFLSRVIYITNENSKGNNIMTDKLFKERLLFVGEKQDENKLLLSNTIIIDKCKFELINSKHDDGSCIYSEANLAVTDSIFDTCFARNGCILCNNSYLALSNTVFQICNAQQMSSCFSQFYQKPKDNIPTQISSVTFIDCKSYNLFGIFYISSPNPVSLTNSNISNCGASQCVGSFEISNSALFIRYTQFSHSYANVHNGCIVLRNADKFFIEKTIFIDCQQLSSLSETGCDLLLYNIPADSLVRDTAFLDSKPSKGFSITAVGGIELNFENCVFSFSKNFEINPFSSYLCVFSDTIFECSNDVGTVVDIIESKNVENPSKIKQCIESKARIENYIQKSNIRWNSKSKQRINKNKYNDNYLNILFEYDSTISSSFTSSKSNSSRVSKFAERIAEKDFFINHQIKKKHVVFFIIYIAFLALGFLSVIAFEFLLRKYPLLCQIKPNKGGFMQSKTPHAIL